MQKLGYDSWTSFNRVVNRSISACASLNVPVMENFMEMKYRFDGKDVSTYKLTRFACFLITMNADSRKPEVLQAKTVLAGIADALVEQAIHHDSVERIEVRNELKDGERFLSGVAMSAGLQSREFGIFRDAGYRGLYNMSLNDLIRYKGMTIEKNKTLYDFMGKSELAANLFRVTQTTERIKNNNVKGLKNLSQTAKSVGTEVRNVMLRSGGLEPENLPLEENINDVKKRIKSASKEMKKIDSQKKKPLK
ncbi:DNA-damage-inducible protein D family protein [Oxalobacter formigenes OXCC13]|uniref:DNA-damage-inducible protein D family protein n=2 Tax=Oxalobacter formigenes TaxID=847 RepID=C3X7Y6_OXAFO|nr:DNA-damage-inducible protein D family protein [Oxalobacter formigenes OXCC13]